MKHLKSLNEYFDSIELRDSGSFDKHKFIANSKNQMNYILNKILACCDYISMFDVDMVGDNLSFYYKDDKKEDTFTISITKKNDKYELNYGFESDDMYEYNDILWFSEKDLLNMFRTKISDSFNRYNQLNNDIN